LNTNTSGIVKKLAKLDGKYLKQDDEGDREGMIHQLICVFLYFIGYISGWSTGKTKMEPMARRIWKSWCDERERCPRVGIIFLDIIRFGSIEACSLLTFTCPYLMVLVILLTRYMKDGEIQLGFPKGKMEYREHLIDCAIREVN
jgi:hypothetical protein